MTPDPTARELLERIVNAWDDGAHGCDSDLFYAVAPLIGEARGSLRRADEPRVEEGLTVEMVADAFHKAMNHGYHGGGWDHGDGDIAAAILANIPASRPPEPPDLRVTKGPGTFGPDATWTIRTAALKDGWDALVAWLIDHCDEPTPQVWTDEDGETGDVWMWCEGHQVRGPRLGRSDPPVADGTVER